MTASILGLITACGRAPDPQVEEGPSFNLSVEEAGFVVKGELFRIYGEASDPVMVAVEAIEDAIDGIPVWRLDTLVHVLVDDRVQERRWRFWVALDPDGLPVVLRREETPQNSALDDPRVGGFDDEWLVGG